MQFTTLCVGGKGRILRPESKVTRKCCLPVLDRSNKYHGRHTPDGFEPITCKPVSSIRQGRSCTPMRNSLSMQEKVTATETDAENCRSSRGRSLPGRPLLAPTAS